jgi:myo-inositol-1(or 4)-monophosphatase
MMRRRSRKVAPAPEPPDAATLAGIEAHAVSIARHAGGLLRKNFGAALDVRYKDDKQTDPVTNADHESQEYLKQAIAEKYPSHGILGEEDEESDAVAPDFVWVLDPLDGTKNFLSGLPLYGCSVGVIYKGAPVAGAVFLPWPADGGGVVFHARKGGGAFMDDEPITVFQSDEPKGSQLITLPGNFWGMFRMERAMFPKLGDPRMTGSIAYELLMVARGTTQFTVTTAPLLWDAAGGVAVVQGAGGLVMRGRRVKGLLGLSHAIVWEPLETFFPNWQSGVTTMKELRKWREPLLLASPGVARYVAANLHARQHKRLRLKRTLRKLRRKKKSNA